MTIRAGMGHNGGPALHFNDAQQAAAFVTPALYRTHAMIEQVYPSFDYAGLVPVNTDGDMWDVGTLVYSGDVAGAADYIGRKAFDIPNVSVNFQQGVSNFHLAGAGYELSVGEVNRFARIVGASAGITEGGQSLGQRKADAANMVAAKFVYDRAIRGSTEKGFTGITNDVRVPAATAPSGVSWNTATPKQKRQDVNAALTDVYMNSRETAIADSLLLPTSAFLDINNDVMDGNSGISVLKFLSENNSYTAITKRPLDIRPSRELETAGAGGTRRIVAYAKDPRQHGVLLPRHVRVHARVPDLVHDVADRRRDERRPARNLSSEDDVLS